MPLRAVPMEACQKRLTRASSQALVRYATNDYSVPTAYGHRAVLVKAFVWEVVISASSDVIARHPRSYEREQMIFDPLHYLALLEQKSHALDQAAPLEGWQLPEEFGELRRQMEARLGKCGRREYVQVLRLLETFSLGEVAAAVRQALRLSGDRLRCGEASVAVRHRTTGKTHIGPALGLAACQQGFRVRFTTAAGLVHELIEARDDKRLLRYQKNIARQELLIVD